MAVQEMGMDEVEAKYMVERFDAVVHGLHTLGAREDLVETQSDEYWAHPTRDFRATGEAFRIRAVADRLWVTYKGPKSVGVIKRRLEVELPFESGTPSNDVRRLLEALGFRSVAEIRKERNLWKLVWRDTEFSIALDTVESLGKFVEVETLAPEDGHAGAEASVVALSKELGLANPIAESYLALLLGEPDG